MLGQFCQTIKNTSLAMAIGFAELSYAARGRDRQPADLRAFGTATLLYVALILLLQAGVPPLLRRVGWSLSRHG